MIIPNYQILLLWDSFLLSVLNLVEQLCTRVPELSYNARQTLTLW